MEKIFSVIAVLMLAVTMSAQTPYSYRYGRLYDGETVLTKKNAADFLGTEDAKRYKTARNLFISGSVFTYTGCAVGLMGCGFMIASAKSDDLADNTLGLTLSTMVAVSGAIGALIGSPLMIAGACKARKIGKNHQRQDIQMYCGCARNGIGLQLFF